MCKTKTEIETIDKTQTLRKTKRMLVRELVLDKEPLSDTSLGARPPKGLGQNETDIRGLETPIEAVDFAAYNARVTGGALAEAVTVGDLRDVIWDGIPEEHKAK